MKWISLVAFAAALIARFGMQIPFGFSYKYDPLTHRVISANSIAFWGFLLLAVFALRAQHSPRKR